MNEESKEPRPQGGALKPKFLNPKSRSRTKFGMTKRAETNSHVMLNLFQHLVYFFSAFSRRTFHPRPQDGVYGFRKMIEKGKRAFIYFVDREHIDEYRSSPMDRRLQWLFLANKMRESLPRKTIELQEAFCEGKI